eukprot:5267219-Prymnesium_polylepis.2
MAVLEDDEVRSDAEAFVMDLVQQPHLQAKTSGVCPRRKHSNRGRRALFPPHRTGRTGRRAGIRLIDR